MINKKFLVLALLTTASLVKATERSGNYAALIAQIALLTNATPRTNVVANLLDPQPDLEQMGIDTALVVLSEKEQEKAAKKKTPSFHVKKPKQSINRYGKQQQKRVGVGGYKNTGRSQK
ncbi:MAG: ribosome biogenesis GTPase A [Alteromonas naphthalenivorans]|jgi:ribosome biogenesis GTPase A